MTDKCGISACQNDASDLWITISLGDDNDPALVQVAVCQGHYDLMSPPLHGYSIGTAGNGVD